MEVLKQYNLILIRYGEVWLKSQKVKIRMLKVLMNNIKRMLKRNGITFSKYQLSKDSSRIFFFFKNEEILRALNILTNSFGIHSISPALRTSSNLKNITERTLEIANEILVKNDTFALRVKRSGKHDYSSMDVAIAVGQAVIDELKDLDVRVNLTNPKKTIFIEIRQEFSYIFTTIIETKWGGLPIETQKKIIAMDIGRLNDLIASFLLMRRGSQIYPILFNVIEDKEKDVKWYSNWKEAFNYIPFNYLLLRKINLVEILNHVSKNLAKRQYLCAICRLIRFEIISKLIKESESPEFGKIRAISDGVGSIENSLCPDNVDLESIMFNYLFSEYPIFTPIIGLNLKKIESFKLNISKHLKTFDYCQFRPRHQDFDKEKLIQIYKSLKLEPIIKKSLENIEFIKII